MKLCINIYSDYKSTNEKDYQGWINEIAADSNTIHDVFNENTGYRVISIGIPAGKNNAGFSIDTKLKLINFDGVKECHLVLNTHGAAGNSDLSDNVIKDIIKYLSCIDVKVSALTALQCNAFKSETLEVAENRVGFKLNERFGGVRLNPSSMKILQGKLNALELKTVQKFIMRGFKNPYNPIMDKNEVIELLQGNAGEKLEVHTRETQLPDKKIERINCAITYVRDVNANATIKDITCWNIATNCLGLVFKEMLEEIKNHFNTDSPCALNEASRRLYEGVKQHAISENTLKEKADFSNNKEFLTQYKAWSKINSLKKPDNNNRLDLLTTYCNARVIHSETRYSERLNFFPINNSGNRKEEATTTFNLFPSG